MIDRHHHILDRLVGAGYIRVTDLASELNVSEMTIRRDLEKLEEDGHLTRTHGGAHIIPGTPDDSDIESDTLSTEREVIGHAADSFIRSGDTIFLDAGPISQVLAATIDDNKLVTIVTNSTAIAAILSNKGNIDTIVLGGTIHGPTSSLTGPLAEDAIKRFKYTRAFLETDGINPDEGFTASSLDVIPVKQLAAHRSNQVIVLAESYKFGKDVLARFLRIDEVCIIITDWHLQNKYRNIFNKNKISLHIAEKPL
jgi:DeoR family fructose operon transcriptional repressor